MTWGRLDDGFHDHPKVDALTLEAIGLWTVCWTWACRHRDRSPTPGFIPEDRARAFAERHARNRRPRRRLTNYQALVAELTTPLNGGKHGLWEPVVGGYLIHDFTDYLPKQRDTEEASRSGRKGAAARWGTHGY